MRSPVGGLLGCAVLAVAAVVARDPVTPVLLLVPVLPVLLARLAPVRALLRALPVLLGAAGISLSTALLAPGAGLAWDRGLAAALRVLAIALPGALLAALVDPTDLADGLVAHLRVPARFAFGALAALRLAPMLQQEWRMIGLARRARGVDAGRNPLAALRLFAGRCLALLVAALRGSARLSTAMDARGFDSGLVRTSSRAVAPLRTQLVLPALALVVAVAATALSVALGTWRSAW